MAQQREQPMGLKTAQKTVLLMALKTEPKTQTAIQTAMLMVQ
jgi:hypothetical protein